MHEPGAFVAGHELAHDDTERPPGIDLHDVQQLFVPPADQIATGERAYARELSEQLPVSPTRNGLAPRYGLLDDHQAAVDVQLQVT